MSRAIVVSIDGFAAFYWSDPRARIPTLRGLAERGVVADGMETVFPSTTWPTHVSIVTGVRPIVHGVVGNRIVNRDTRAREDLTGDPVYDASRIIKAPTVYDRAASRGLAVAAIEYFDGLLGRFLGSLPAGALDDQTALFVVSDHGFLPVEHEIRINVALRRLGVLQVDGSALTGDARFAMNAGAGYVYALGGDR